MLFNPMDLILLKELFYDVNSIPYNIISDFINKLLNLQNKTALGRITEEEQNVLGALFFKKQEMIEFAYQIAKLNIFGDKEISNLKFFIGSQKKIIEEYRKKQMKAGGF